MNLEQYFDQFRKNIVGIQQTFLSPYRREKNEVHRLDCKWKVIPTN